jgi:MFS family permease
MAFLSSVSSLVCSKGKLGLVVNSRLKLCGGTPAISLSKVLASNPAQCLQLRLSSSDTQEKKPSGLLDKLFGFESNTASPSTNRWSMFIPAFSTHVCLGAPYGWSAISAAMTRENGLVASAASDWTLDLATYPMSIMIAAGGIGAAVFGKWTIKVGVRKAMACGSLLFGAGFGVSALGVATHSLPVLYAGNLMCGIGYGCAYTPPIQALIDWFPDKKGLASGLVIAGFGSGALFFTPMMNTMMSKFSQVPTYLGNTVDVVVEGGKQFAKVGGELQEVVYATAADLSKLPYDGLAEGFYLVGSGNTGVAASLAAIGAIYTTMVLGSSMLMKRPPAGYIPQGYTPPPASADGTGANVHVDTVLKTPQFWLLFTTSTLLATGGMGLMSVAKPMIQNVFTDAMPALVTTSFASAYLMAMAAGNLAGRLGWAAVSDKIGRRNTFHMYTLGAIPIFGSLPFLINQCVTDPTGPLAPMYLAAFCGSTVAAISIMGGVFAVLPAYEADLYGPKYVGAIHGRFLLAATVSTIVGPGLLLTLRKIAEADALKDLLSKVDPSVFADKFGLDLSQAQVLIEAKTLTISKLMTIMPPGTIDPSPFLYNNTMYTMAGLVSVAAALHFMVRPVNKKYFEKA